MAKLSYEELKVVVASMVTAGLLSKNGFNATVNNTVGLLDKVGKIVTLDSNYAIDKLNIFDGEYLSFGKTIEEWSADLIEPEAHDASGANALAPHRSTYRPVFYSYTLGRKMIPQTIDYDDLERAVHFEEQYVSLIAMKYKRISDSMAAYRYQIKREMIAKLYAIATDSVLAIEGGATATWALGSNDEDTAWSTAVNSTARNNGTFVLVVSGGTDGNGNAQFNGKYINVKPIPASFGKSLKEAVAEGYVIKFDLVKEIAKPVDETTGEAFIKQLKQDVEVAGDLSEGRSLNGNSLGATDGLVLVVKQGVIPSLEADTWSGAFHKEMLALPAETIVVKDFGDCDAKVYSLLIDKRGMRLHNTYDRTFENLNGEGGFLNVFRHTEDTAYISRNCFVRFYKEA